eukprot:SAG22_NODE_825_length_6973_cov_2.846523_4_plen_109_part_00
MTVLGLQSKGLRTHQSINQSINQSITTEDGQTDRPTAVRHPPELLLGELLAELLGKALDLVFVDKAGAVGVGHPEHRLDLVALVKVGLQDYPDLPAVRAVVACQLGDR